VLDQQGNLEDALEQYRRALEIQEEKAPKKLNVASSYMFVAKVYKEKGQLTESLRYLEQSHSIFASQSIVAWHPSLIQCKFELCLLFVEERRFHEALPYANYIIHHLSNYKWAYNLKARALTGLGKLTEALDIYKKVLSLAPNDSDAHIGRLALLVKMSK
jgi:tetratricopeptide (TPR) repeat protein